VDGYSELGYWIQRGASAAKLQIFRPLRMFKIVLRDSSLYPKQLSLFRLLRLISASAKGIGYITNFCSMIRTVAGAQKPQLLK